MVPWLVVSETVVMGSSPGTGQVVRDVSDACCSRRERSALPWARATQIRLRNRNLRNRRLHCQRAKNFASSAVNGSVLCVLPLTHPHRHHALLLWAIRIVSGSHYYSNMPNQVPFPQLREQAAALRLAGKSLREIKE